MQKLVDVENVQAGISREKSSLNAQVTELSRNLTEARREYLEIDVPLEGESRKDFQIRTGEKRIIVKSFEGQRSRVLQRIDRLNTHSEEAILRIST